jgi:hypothetical protein
VQVGYGVFHARQSFEAVLGQTGGAWFGGGVQYQFRQGPFVQGSVERFRRTGERVFVFDGRVFPLGIPDTVTVMPLALTVGYRLNRLPAAPYVGGGVGRYYFREESPAADPSENVDQRSTSYHAVGGIEGPIGRSVAAAIELEYASVPDALEGGAAAAFDEHDLGGIQVRVRLSIGGF